MSIRVLKYEVQIERGGTWSTVSNEVTMKSAVELARKVLARSPTIPVRVLEHIVDPETLEFDRRLLDLSKDVTDPTPFPAPATALYHPSPVHSTASHKGGDGPALLVMLLVLAAVVFALTEGVAYFYSMGFLHALIG